MAPTSGEMSKARPEAKGEKPVKVCNTCRYWSYRYKGYCARLKQGVGRFWMCEEWSAAAEGPREEGIPKGPGEASSQS